MFHWYKCNGILFPSEPKSIGSSKEGRSFAYRTHLESGSDGKKLLDMTTSSDQSEPSSASCLDVDLESLAFQKVSQHIIMCLSIVEFVTDSVLQELTRFLS